MALDTYHAEPHRSHRRPRPRRISLPVQFRRPPQPWTSRFDNLAPNRFCGQRGRRTVYLQETARHEENFQLLETITPVDNRVIVLRRDRPYAHSIRQLGVFVKQ